MVVDTEHPQPSGTIAYKWPYTNSYLPYPGVTTEMNPALPLESYPAVTTMPQISTDPATFSSQKPQDKRSIVHFSRAQGGMDSEVQTSSSVIYIVLGRMCGCVGLHMVSGQQAGLVCLE